jgi:hypothetical protein
LPGSIGLDCLSIGVLNGAFWTEPELVFFTITLEADLEKMTALHLPPMIINDSPVPDCTFRRKVNNYLIRLHPQHHPFR